VNSEGYYTHPKFSPMPRTNHEAKVNLSEDLTAPFVLFKLFFPQALVELMVTLTNKYAQQMLRAREASGVEGGPSFSRKHEW
jgi:hypothetical protein